MQDIRISTESMSAVDRAWLEMDSPGNPMIVSAIIEFEGVANLKRLAATIVQRLLRYPRFRQRAQDRHGSPRWLPCEDVCVGYHVRLHRLPGHDPERELRQAVAAELSEELDRSLPLWRMTFFPRGPGKAVALFRAHHAMADGIALMQLLMTLADDAQQSDIDAAAIQAVPRGRRHGPLAGLIRQIETVNLALEKVGAFLRHDLDHPEDALEQLRVGKQALAAVAHLVGLPENNPARFRASLSGYRAVAWNGDRPFAPIKRFARAHGIKINDVFLAALTGAFRRYLLEADCDEFDLRNLRVSIPVNLRTSADGAFGNHFGLVMLDLPIGVPDAGTRLALVAERMVELKNSPEARAVLACLAAAGHLPPTVEKGLVNYLAAKTATVVSNLPGPRRQITIGGARLAKLVFWPPQTGGVGVGVSLFSYAGRVTMGVSADTHLIPDPQKLIEAFNLELDTLLGPATGRARRRPRPARAESALTAD